MGGLKVAVLVVGLALLTVSKSLVAIDSFESRTFVVADSVGSAVSGVALGADSLLKNPGTLTTVSGTEFHMMAGQEFDSAVFLARLGIVGSFSGVRYSVQLPFKTIQGLVKTGANDSGEGVVLGTYADQQFSMLASVVTDWQTASWGLTLRMISNQIDSDSGSGMGMDCGVYKELNPKLSAGLAIRNVAQTVSWTGRESESVPLTVSTGLRYWVQPRLALLGDTDISAKKIAINLGGIYFLSPQVELRGGIDSVLDSPQIHLGIGMNMARMSVDYSFSQVEPLGVSHRVGVRYALL